MVMKEERREAQRFTQPVHHMDFQFCARRTGGLFIPYTDFKIGYGVSLFNISSVPVYAVYADKCILTVS